jgi:CobW/HypB/UreG, nucleotide-binding domain
MALPAPLPILVKMRPMVMITGFLGAGKTSFLRELLEHLPSHHLTADVILNDYENAELDAETIHGKAGSIAALSASCACCGGFDDLIKLSLAAQEARSDVLLVELNGTADPISLLETFTLLESKLRFRPRWQIAILDASQFGHRGMYDELELAQLQTASHYVLTHTDQVSKSRRDDVLFPARVRTPKITAWLRSLPDTVIRAKALVTTPEKPDCRQLFERVGLDFLPGPIERVHLHAAVRLVPPVMSAERLRKWLLSLPQEILRIKGLVDESGALGLAKAHGGADGDGIGIAGMDRCSGQQFVFAGEAGSRREGRSCDIPVTGARMGWNHSLFEPLPCSSRLAARKAYRGS